MLSDTACKKAAATGETYRLSDSLGLYLHVTPTGHKSWRLGYWFAKVKKRLVLGSYPEMSLAQAREARDEARRFVAAGTDPAVVKKQRAAAHLVNSAATFKVIAEGWLAEQRPRWNGKHAKNVSEALQRDIYPVVGGLPIGEVTKPIVVQMLRKIEQRGAVETAKRHRQRIEEIFSYADALGYEVKNPADVRKALKPLTRGRWPALTEIGQLRQMLMAVESVPSHPVTKLASRFIALTAVRPGVAQAVIWGELPPEDAVDPIWIIPAERMKLSKERKDQEAFDHHVPLSRQAMDVLAALRVLTGHGVYAFPSSLTMRRPISDSTVSKLYREAGYQGVHVPHGWRAAFSTVMNELAMKAERPGDRVVIDLMLAHQQKGVEPIYNRALYMPRRREIAQEWADMLLAGLPSPSALLTLPRR
ncbi:MAG: integrase arm-type DNA-binding domain-containing protein [Pseudomonadota bacterium]|nr:integrase arm-type DNA-binding domain-containing protein [Pseudomonadota bacterium]